MCERQRERDMSAIETESCGNDGRSVCACVCVCARVRIIHIHERSLTKDAQHALRRTMEKYASTCRVILCANSTSKAIPAIRSRCLGVRVAAPSVDEIVAILHNVCKKEGLNIPTEFAQKVRSYRYTRRPVVLESVSKLCIWGRC